MSLGLALQPARATAAAPQGNSPGSSHVSKTLAGIRRDLGGASYYRNQPQ